MMAVVVSHNLFGIYTKVIINKGKNENKGI
jgi:hypothetical protein